MTRQRGHPLYTETVQYVYCQKAEMQLYSRKLLLQLRGKPGMWMADEFNTTNLKGDSQ